MCVCRAEGAASQPNNLTSSIDTFKLLNCFFRDLRKSENKLYFLGFVVIT